MRYALTEAAVYTIATPERLAAAAESGDFLYERKRWTKARELYGAARAAGLDVPVLFADSRDCSTLIAWSVLRDVQVADAGTHYRIAALHRLPCSTPQDLAVLSTGRHIAEGFIRPYVLCRTPKFLIREAETPGAWSKAVNIASGAREGERYLAVHIRRERNRSLVVRLKEARLNKHSGRLPCDVCGFDFSQTYGPIGDGFAEAHHCEPLGGAPAAGRTTDLADLALVCSNCHSMLHRGPNFPSVAELRERVRKIAGRNKHAG
jgi:hypothetical protein